MIFFFFWIIQENKAEDLLMLLDELFFAFQINFHHHKFLNDFHIFTFKSCMNYMNDECSINFSFSVHDNITQGRIQDM